MRWINRVPQALEGTRSSAQGVSSDGANFAGLASSGVTGFDNTPVVWLAQDGHSLRMLRDRDGGLLPGRALGVLDDGFAFGESWGAERFGWIWHPSSGTDRVTRIGDWLALFGIQTTPIESVRDVHATEYSYHFSLRSGQHSWYVQTPKTP